METHCQRDSECSWPIEVEDYGVIHFIEKTVEQYKTLGEAQLRGYKGQQ